MPVTVWATQKDHQRHSNCKLEKSIRLSLPALIPTKITLSWTSKNLLDWLPLELRNWDYGLLQSLTIVFILFL